MTTTISEQIFQIQQEIQKLKPNANIHTLLREDVYFRKLAHTKPFSFSIHTKYQIKQNKTTINIHDQKSTNTEYKTKSEFAEAEKYTNFAFAGEGNNFSNRMVACTNKGNTYIYNIDNGNIISHFTFDGRILTACAIEPTENQIIAVGGFDGAINIKSIYTIDHLLKNDNISKQFTGHLGCVSSIRFMSSSFMISASYDSIVYLWDIYAQGRIVKTYGEHTGEVVSLDVNEVNGNIFATGSGDTTVKLWDIREKKANVATFQGSDSCINCVKFLPGRLCTLAAGSEDSSLCLYDLRALHNLGIFYKNKGDNSAINSIGFTKSGSILFASSNDNNKLTFWKLFGKESPFCIYEHKNSKSSTHVRSGLNRTSINADGSKIGFIYRDEIVIVQ